MQMLPVFKVFLFAFRCSSICLVHKCEAGAYLLVNLFVIFVNNIIVEMGVCLMSLYPCLFNGYILPHLIFGSLIAEVFRAEIEQEFLVRLETFKSCLVLVNLTLRLGNLLVKLLDLFLLGKLFAVEGLFLVFFLLLHLLVSCNVLMQVHLVVLEFLRRFN